MREKATIWRLPGQQESLAHYLRAARKDRGLSLDAVVRGTSLSLSTIRKIEGGNTQNPGLFTLHELWRLLDLPWEALGQVNPPSALHEEQ